MTRTRLYLVLESITQAIGLAAFIAVLLLWALIAGGGLPL